MNVTCIDCADVIPGAARQRRRCDPCRDTRKAGYGRPIRSLGPDEEPPPGEPRRYVNGRGYVRLRWATDGEYVETYEHRLLVGAQAGVEVHHIDGDPANNDLCNLQVLTPEQHREAHEESRRRIDVDEAVRLYDLGLGTQLVGKRMGFDPSAIWRALKRAGHPIRPGLGGGPKRKVPPA